MGAKSELKNQVYLYSVDTLDFYTDEEKKWSDKYFKAIRLKYKIRDKKKVIIEYINYIEHMYEENDLEMNDLHNKMLNKLDLYTYRIKIINSYIDYYELKLNQLLDSNTSVRTLREDALKSNKIIALFESSLTRILKLKHKECTDSLFVIRVYHYKILDSILKNGFLYNKRKYEYFTSSAGQIRTKKMVCIDSEVYDEHKNAITCGLNVEDINSKGGVNSNKYQAYLALINSASRKWERFNINRMIVVDDFSTTFETLVDNIDTSTFEISREKKKITIEHMDGCGIMLPTVSKSPFMFRMPWMKGLLAPFSFDKFIKENNVSSKIKDIYGKEWDIIEDKISIILTKSQFKMYAYYDSWQDYKDKFVKFKCEASKLNEEDVGADANLNYQMLQTLTTVTDEELNILAKDTADDILSLGNDRKTMLRVLGATKENKNKNYFQKSLLAYPEMLGDVYSREVIKDKKKSLINDARAGKLRINGKYTYVIPDLYAFCEWLFLGKENPKGLLENEQVYCSIFKEGKVDVLRAPHLYREHAIRNNVLNDGLSKWFTTKAIYTSVHDAISRILQFDNDGDKLLVVQNETLTSIAEREMEDIVPLYYEMKKAKAELINAETLYKALTSAYKANIGIISNDITKIWNSDNPNINAVKWLTMFNNFVIDYAKTLYLPKFPEEVEKEIKKFTKSKLPFFFQFAKDKEEENVEKRNNSTVNKLYKIIPDKPIQFKRVTGKFDYRNLMNTKYPEPSQKLIDKYNELNKSKYRELNDDSKSGEFRFDEYMRKELSALHKSDKYIVDVLIEYLYSSGNKNKEALWDAYGDIVYENILNNLGDTISCEVCKMRIKMTNGNKHYCEVCAKKILQIQKNKWKREKWKKSSKL